MNVSKRTNEQANKCARSLARSHIHIEHFTFLLQSNTYILINVKSLWYEYGVNFMYIEF